MMKLSYSTYLKLFLLFLNFWYGSTARCKVCNTYQNQPHLPICAENCSQNITGRSCRLVTFSPRLCLLDEVIQIGHENNIVLQGMPTEIKCVRVPHAGLWLRQVNNLTIRDLTLVGCGVLHNKTSPSNTLYFFWSAVTIEESTGVTIEELTVSGSYGTGLTMVDCGGIVNISKSKFEKNSLSSSLEERISAFGGSGLLIQFSNCGCRPVTKPYLNYCVNVTSVDITNSEYYIYDSTFIENTNIGCPRSDLQENTTGFGSGGGIGVFIGGQSKENKFIIQNCYFLNNTASWGGGLYVVIQDKSTLNKISVRASRFRMNHCNSSISIGGGVDVGFILLKSLNVTSNSIHFHDCIFLDNRAMYGGGGHFFSNSFSYYDNTIEIVNCTWIHNSACYGAALEVTPSFWGADFHAPLIVKLKDNRIISNYVYKENSQRCSSGKGAVLVDKTKVHLSGTILFESNNGSALYLDSSRAFFEADSSIRFINNHGYQGGAIAMFGLSTIKFSDNSTFLFANNSAEDGGGAVFQSAVGTRDIYMSRICFIQYSGNKDEHNTTFKFINNSATPGGRQSTQQSRYGHSILTTTILTCLNSIQISKPLNQNEVLDSIGNFTFDDQCEYDVSTFESSVTAKKDLIYVVPGMIVDLGLNTIDDFSNNVEAVYCVSVLNRDSNSQVSVDSKFMYTSNGQIKVYGWPGNEATIVLKSTTIRKATTEIQIVINECPPAYVLQDNDGKAKCTCISEIMPAFLGNIECNKTHFQAKLFRGIWMGYSMEKTFGKERDLIYSHCYGKRCLNGEDRYVLLPDNTNTSQMNLLFCGEFRTGILCSKCRSNYSLNYHSSAFSCSPSPDMCMLGWFYYILSELVPVTVFFVTVTAFDIRLASGLANSLILFMQLSDSFQIGGNGIMRYPNIGSLKWPSELYFMITGVFRMDFFESEWLKFCLWKTARTSDLLAIKYVTILYALSLVVGIILALKYGNFKFFKIIRRRLDLVPLSSTIIHGVSGFLIICYSEATKISLLLLDFVNIYSFGNDSQVYIRRTVAAADGELLFFRGRHLLYALPALFVLGVLGLAPPLLLFSYPLCYKLFGVLRISESRLIKVLCILIPLEKCKPFFDSFQSGFKDKCRFFSGLYFLYRLVILLLVLISKYFDFNMATAIQFLVMILLHAIFRPLKNEGLNKVDILLFSDLLIISLLAIIINDYDYTFKYQYLVNSIQVTLLYLPLICVSICGGKTVISRVCRKSKRKKEESLLSYHNFSALDAAEGRCENITPF